MRQAIPREIGKAIEDQAKVSKGQTSMDLEEGEMTVEDRSTSVIVGEVNIIKTPQLEEVIFIDEHSS